MQQSESFVQEVVEWYKTVLSRYADFDGRAGRREFWMFVLGHFVIIIGLALVEQILGLDMGGYGLLSSIYSIAIFVPALAVSIRRLHDTGKTGFLVLIGFIPVVGWIGLIVLYAQEGDFGANEYGPDPKGGRGQSAQTPMHRDVHPR